MLPSDSVQPSAFAVGMRPKALKIGAQKLGKRPLALDVQQREVNEVGVAASDGPLQCGVVFLHAEEQRHLLRSAGLVREQKLRQVAPISPVRCRRNLGVRDARPSPEPLHDGIVDLFVRH